MTSEKHLKARIRARMARTGERYSTARRHVVDAPDASTDHGHVLRGGTQPDAAAVATVTGLSEAMVLGIGGGLGAGYILWQFKAHDKIHLTLGYRYRWNYLDWVPAVLDRLGTPHRTHRTAGEKTATAALDAALDAGKPALVVPDWYHVGYWQLPPHLDGHGGHHVIAYARVGDRIRIDDRNLAPLTVDAAVLAKARGRVPSYQNQLVVIDGPGDAEVPDLGAAVDAGVTACIGHLGGSSTSFAAPAWRKWAKLMTDTRNPKGWPQVFAGGAGLVDALAAIWEGVEPVGMDGGHLRDLYADFLEEAAALRPALAGAAPAFRAAGGAWHALAEAALPADVPEYAAMRDLMAAVAAGVAAGDAGSAERAEAAAQLWELRARHAAKPPVDADFALLADRLGTVYEAEMAAVGALRAAVR